MEPLDPKKPFWTSIPVIIATITALIGAVATLITVLHDGKDSNGSDDKKKETEVFTIEVSKISSTSAISGGYIISDNETKVTNRGVCWSPSQQPTISDSKSNDGNGTGTYISEMTDLKPNTVYYYRAYAITPTQIEPLYGKVYYFTTHSTKVPPAIKKPEVGKPEIIAFNHNSAGILGRVLSEGGGVVSERGLCWNTYSDASCLGNRVISPTSGIGSYTISLTGLIPNTQYYVRAYAINEAGEKIGDETIFETISPPSEPAPSIINANFILSDYGKSNYPNAYGSISYENNQKGQFIGKIKVNGLPPGKKYLLTICGRLGGTDPSNELIRSSFGSKCKQAEGKNYYANLLSFETKSYGETIIDIAPVLVRGNYSVKLFIQEGVPNYKGIFEINPLEFSVD